MSGGRFRDLAVPFPWPETCSGLPQIRLSEDGETICAILQAIHPFPSVPIRSLALGLKCLTAANKYGLQSSLFRIDYSVLVNAGPFGAPFDLCVLAWGTGDWEVVKHAFRFTHSIPTSELISRALRLPKGGEMLAACLATRAQRHSAFLDVVSVLPTGLLCASCRSSGYGASMALVRAISTFFNAPFPDTSRVFDDPETTWLPHGSACATCLASVRAVRYTPQQYHSVKLALDSVPQTILPWIIEEKAARFRRELEAVWSH